MKFPDDKNTQILPAFSRVEILSERQEQVSFPLAQTVHFDSDREAKTQLFCHVESPNQQTKSFPVDDYERIYNIPGLYEHLFYEKMNGSTLDVIERLFVEEVRRMGGLAGLPEKFRVLDLGAGNGLMGERISKCAHRYELFEEIVGIDMLEAAKSAAERDRAGLYTDYYVVDFTDPPQSLVETLLNQHFNCLTSVSRLGFNDICAQAFANAYNLLNPNAYIIFNVRDGIFPSDNDNMSDFGRLIRLCLEHGIMTPRMFERYCHSHTPTGKDRYFIASIARKKKAIPPDLLAEAVA